MNPYQSPGQPGEPTTEWRPRLWQVGLVVLGLFLFFASFISQPISMPQDDLEAEFERVSKKLESAS